MKKFYVYVHTCNANGKRYVGCTTYKPEYRWGRNGEGYKGQLFGKAVRKYGWSSITHEVFEVDSEEEMYRKEIELISFYHSNDPEYGYNCSTGGEKGALGCKHSEESRKKMSEALKGKSKLFSEEHKRHIAEASKKRWLDPEYREKISKALKGKSKPFSEEHKRHIAASAKKRANDPENRRKMSEARKGKPKPRVKIQLPDGTIVEITKQHLVKDYVNKNKAFEYVS